MLIVRLCAMRSPVRAASLAGLFLGCGLLLFAAAPAARAAQGEPTDEEQYMLELINRARADPAAEYDRLDITGTAPTPQPPLAMNDKLLACARRLGLDQICRQYVVAYSNGDLDPDGKKANRRVRDAGYDLPDSTDDATYYYADNDNSCENVAFAWRDVKAAYEALFQIKAQRELMLGVGDFFKLNDEAGMGVILVRPYDTQGMPYSSYFTQIIAHDAELDGGVAFTPRLLGVVYDDLDGDGMYSPGEGLGGVTITFNPGADQRTTTTSSSGGYVIALGGVPAASYDVTASGGGVTGTLTESGVAFAGKNVKVDFVNFTPAYSDGKTVLAFAAARADDAEENVTPTPSPLPVVPTASPTPWPLPVSIAGAQLVVGQNRLIGLRLPKLLVPQGATIYSARMKFHCYGGGANPIAITYSAEDAGSAQQFEAVKRDLLDPPRWRVSSGVRVDDTPGNWAGGVFVRSPDLTGMIQEIVNRGDWQSGNAVVVFLEDHGSTGQRGLTAWDDRAIVDGVTYDGTSGHSNHSWYWHSAKLYVAYQSTAVPTPTATATTGVTKGGGGCALPPGGRASRRTGTAALLGLLLPYLAACGFFLARRMLRTRRLSRAAERA